MNVEGQHNWADNDVNVKEPDSWDDEGMSTEEKDSWATWVEWGEQKDIDEAIWTEYEDRYERERELGLLYTSIAPILSDADIVVGLEVVPPWISSTEE